MERTKLFFSIMLCLVGVGFVFFDNLAVILLVVLLIFILLFTKLALFQKLKVKYIYPRMGYVKFKEDYQIKMRKSHLLLFLIAVICVALFFILIFSEELSIAITLTYIPIIIGGALLAKSTNIFIFSGKKYYLGFGILSFILAIIFILIPMPIYRDHVIFYTWTISILLFLLGGSKLSLFLKQNPIVQESETR